MYKTCPLCGSNNTVIVAVRNNFPVLQNVLCESLHEAENFKKRNLELWMCGDCGFAFNAAFTPVHYDFKYENNQE